MLLFQAQQIKIGVFFFAMGRQSTSKLNKRDFSELIEVIYWFGAEQGVRWSAPSMAIFETYMEAQEK